MKELSIAIVISAMLIALSNRYSVGGGDYSLVVDNFTGRAWSCTIIGCRSLQTERQ